MSIFNALQSLATSCAREVGYEGDLILYMPQNVAYKVYMELGMHLDRRSLVNPLNFTVYTHGPNIKIISE